MSPLPLTSGVPLEDGELDGAKRFMFHVGNLGFTDLGLNSSGVM